MRLSGYHRLWFRFFVCAVGLHIAWPHGSGKFCSVRRWFYWPNFVQFDVLFSSTMILRHCFSKLKLCAFHFEKQRQCIYRRSETLSSASLFFGYILLKLGITYTWNYAHFVTTLFSGFTGEAAQYDQANEK